MPWPTLLELHALPFILLFYAASSIVRHYGSKAGWLTDGYLYAYPIPVIAAFAVAVLTGHGLLETLTGQITAIGVLLAQLFILRDAYKSREWTARYLAQLQPGKPTTSRAGCRAEAYP